MEEVTITGVSVEGDRVARLIHSKANIALRDRFLYRQLYDEVIVKERPFTIKIRLKNRAIGGLLKADDLIERFRIEFCRRGLEENVDYIIEGV